MSFKPVYLSAFEQNTGLNTYFEPAFIPETAFPIMEDAYAFRGRVKRRRGVTQVGRLRRALSASSMGNITAAGPGVLNVNIFTALGVAATEPNAQLVPGNITNITITIGAQTLTDTTGTGVMVVTAGVITSATISYITGNLALTYSGPSGPDAAAFTGAYYPMLPVMGIRLRETSATNEEDNIYFDQKYAYQFTGGVFAELPAVTPTTWRGSDADFFWSTNYWYKTGTLLFWATNFNNAASFDPLRYYDNTDWTTFTPLVSTGNTLWTCKAIIPYKNRLLAFNTWEGATGGGQGAATNFPNRVRWSVNGDPTVSATSWLSDVVGQGGFLDAPTNEKIISVEFIKDVLLVKFERSSWKLIYTGNPALPFIFEKINTELGSESTFSLVPFDGGVYSIGNYGITTDSSINVVRIDENIPQQIFEIANANDGPIRVHGIRDYVNELVYWTYPDGSTNATTTSNIKFPNKVLVYNYRNNSWSKFNDSFTCYGYFQPGSPYTWATLPSDLIWARWEDAWGSAATQALFPFVVAGNQQGFIMQVSENVSNGNSLAIIAIGQFGATTEMQIKIPNHNLQVGQFIVISGIVGSGVTNPNFLNGNTYQVRTVVDVDNITLNSMVFDPVSSSYIKPPVEYNPIGTYISGGVVSVLNNMDVWTKRFSFFYDRGSQTRLGWIDFMCDATEEGQFTANVYINENNVLPLNNAYVDAFTPIDSVSNANVILTSPENTALYPFQAQSDKIWHRMYAYVIGQNFQVEMTMSDVQMFGIPDATGTPTAPTIPTSEIVVHAFTPYVDANARLTP